MLLPVLLAAGVLTTQSEAGSGAVDVPDERTAVAAKLQGLTTSASGIPYGAVEWQQPFDPGDLRPFALSFDEVLDTGDAIIAIQRIAMSPQAATLGVIVDESSGHAPIIEETGKRKVQLWFAVNSGAQEGLPFDASGVKLPVSIRVATARGQRVERTAVLTVRQL